MADIQAIKAKYSTLQDVIRYASIDVVKLAMKHVRELDIPYNIQKVYNAALGRDDKIYSDIAKWALRNGAKYNRTNPDITSIVTPFMGYVPVVNKDWYNPVNISATINSLIKRYDNLQTIIRNGHKDQIDFAMSHMSRIPYDIDEVMIAAVEKGYANIARTLVGKYKLNEPMRVAKVVAMHGYLDVLKSILSAVDNDMLIAYNDDIMLAAIKGKHVDIVKYMDENSSKSWDEWEEDNLDSDEEIGDEDIPELIEFWTNAIHESGYDKNIVMYAMSKGIYDDSGSDPDEWSKIMSSAKAHGQYDTVKWLNDNYPSIVESSDDYTSSDDT